MRTIVTTMGEYGKDEHKLAKWMTILIRYFTWNLEKKPGQLLGALCHYTFTHPCMNNKKIEIQ